MILPNRAVRSPMLLANEHLRNNSDAFGMSQNL